MIEQPENQPSKRNVAAFRVFVLGIIFGGGCVGYGVHWNDMRRIESVSTNHIAIDGREVRGLETCSLGCRTEEDDICEKFVNLIKKDQ